ncbi:N-acetylglucosaminyldiphosphoundecaprenol N-acetyl-beta-D-mannosaminyltransferase [Nonomuraea jiangxiensis]|uniref:N-acetylglucosaminyldiphosphoundecaprenol N-acetyl-beta-D-mannosaminyltransferase n=1 Tax=Nonomuraea jiangxiensis TaxID=633440 RepID=A0A1G8MEN0_9ACTN|nr:N-acetylglucosaminyldiphosphoundecaprenol N-acetyl-beta-D-mannosaminyltransferase [Nonomuraea jiangxiensis]
MTRPWEGSDDIPDPSLTAAVPPARARVGTIHITSLTEAEVAAHVSRAWARGRGGTIVTANVDIVRAAARDPLLTALVERAELVVADGMPVVWAGRLAGVPIPERVTGSSLVHSLSERAAADGRSVYLLGGDPGVPEAAAAALVARYATLRIAGTHSPPYGFDGDPAARGDAVGRVAAAGPDLVLVGLGFPKQERLIEELRAEVPAAWYLGCGAGIPMAAGQFSRAPRALQSVGGEWLHRLALEPRRLARRYLREDAPFAVALLARALLSRFRRS